jgi:hypothetical protein
VYYFIENRTVQGSIRQIIRPLSSETVQSFPDVESNTGPERAAYLEWLAEGNTPEPWPPAE